MAYNKFNCFFIRSYTSEETGEPIEESTEIVLRTKLVRESKIRKFVLNKLNIPDNEVTIFKTFKARL